MKPEVVAIVAVAKNGVVGAGNAIPWRLSSDMRRFKALTMGKPLIVGRRTYQSFPRALPGREMIVVTRDFSFSAPGARIAHSPQAALALARKIAAASGASQICVGGGPEIYRALLSEIDRIELTEVALTPEGDAFVEPFDPAIWRETARLTPERGPKDEADFAFVTLERRRR